MKKFFLSWAGLALAFLAAGGIAGIFLPGGIEGRIGSGVIAILAACGAWRCWNLASGHAKPKPRRTPTPEQRPWQR